MNLQGELFSALEPCPFRNALSRVVGQFCNMVFTEALEVVGNGNILQYFPLQEGTPISALSLCQANDRVGDD